VLVSKVHLEGFIDEDVISRQDHEQETEKLELEIQQCKEMIKTQQQLLQVNVNYLLKLFSPMKGQNFTRFCIPLFHKIYRICHFP
jgi:hypothetical protein